MFAHIRLIFQQAALRYDLERLPTDRLKPRGLGLVARPRQRVLSDREIAALWRACDTMGCPFGPFIKMLLMTGCRRNEVADARWSEIDLAARTSTVPRERAKADSPHLVPTTDELVVLLASLPRHASGDFVFSTCWGRNPISGFSKCAARVHRLMRAELGEAMPAFCLHDLRRTFRSRLSECGVSERVAELANAHSRTGIARVYDCHAFGRNQSGGRAMAPPAARHPRAGSGERRSAAGVKTLGTPRKNC
jgi:integrase